MRYGKQPQLSHSLSYLNDTQKQLYRLLDLERYRPVPRIVSLPLQSGNADYGPRWEFFLDFVLYKYSGGRGESSSVIAGRMNSRSRSSAASMRVRSASASG